MIHKLMLFIAVPFTCFSGAALAGKIATSGLPAGLLATGLIIGALCIITACQRLSNPDGR